MQQQNGLTPWNPLDDMRKGHGVLMLVATIWATPVQILMRKAGSMGSRYISWHFWVGLFGPILFCQMLFPHFPQWPATCFSLFVGSLMILHWIKADPTENSVFFGRSGLGEWKGVYTVGEPVAFFLAGAACMALSPGLGIYMMGAGLASSLFHGNIAARDASRLRAMRDAEIEQNWIMAQHRRRRGE